MDLLTAAFRHSGTLAGHHMEWLSTKNRACMDILVRSILHRLYAVILVSRRNDSAVSSMSKVVYDASGGSSWKTYHLGKVCSCT